MELFIIIPPPPTIPPHFTNMQHKHIHTHTQIVNPLAATPHNHVGCFTTLYAPCPKDPRSNKGLANR